MLLSTQGSPFSLELKLACAQHEMGAFPETLYSRVDSAQEMVRHFLVMRINGVRRLKSTLCNTLFPENFTIHYHHVAH